MALPVHASELLQPNVEVAPAPFPSKDSVNASTASELGLHFMIHTWEAVYHKMVRNNRQYAVPTVHQTAEIALDPLPVVKVHNVTDIVRLVIS